jgi:hypothetical protein
MEKLLNLLDRRSPVTATDDELAALLGSSQLHREEKTGVAGVIRVMTVGDVVLVQEQTPEREILIRRRDDIAAADAFVDERLKTYDRMWDG